MNDVLAIITKTAVEFPSIDRGRIYLTGLSMGGVGAWSLAARHPNLFAAVVPICGHGDVTTAHRLVNLPIWAIHGDADRVVPVQGSRDVVNAICKAGGNPNYSELPGVGHNCWTSAYSDRMGVLAWMFSQVKSRPASVLERLNIALRP